MPMLWTVENTDEFREWFAELDNGEQVDVRAVIGLLEEQGPQLPHPYSSGIEGSKTQAHARASYSIRR